MAWAPESLAAESIATGALATLDGALPTLEMKVLMTRVAGQEQRADDAWAILSGGRPAAQGAS